MSYKSIFSWKVTVKLPESTQTYKKSNKLFNVRTGHSFIKGIGGLSSYDFCPTVLDPTNVFHNALNKIKKNTGFKGRRFPYENAEGARLNANIRLFGEDLVVITFDLSTVVESNIDEIFDLQNISSHKHPYELVRHICGLVLSGNITGYEPISSPKVYPCVKTTIFGGDDQWISDSKAVEIITRHLEPTQSIVNKVIDKNHNHQLDKSHILLDRQGVFYRIPQSLVNSNSVDKKFLGTCNLFEYAIAISILLNESYIDNLGKEELVFLNELIFEPEILFLNSVTSLETWKLLKDEFRLTSLMTKALNGLQEQPKEIGKLRSILSWIKSVSPESKTGVLIMLVVSGLYWGFSQSIYFPKFKKLFSTPDINIIKPVDTSKVTSTNGKVYIDWEEVDGAKDYVISLEVLDSGKWSIPSIDHRTIEQKTEYDVTVTINNSYQFKVKARDNVGDVIAESNYSSFRVTEAKSKEKTKLQNKVKTNK
ncbi:hypothetical protein H5162_20595 [Pseudoalteromonas sp. SR41-8]|uniref:hypothetical protein n=1 Tax=Pseudoalteromonas sp. SR41-8 TaxID=2760946 RepID=UPI001601AEFC|nr:hypothetical protein [Pseudoalteromonas sp. SR41-8]MBB1311811.1 hypothetical protein [Pseudoalteromonas sp. SR41-8]